MNFMTELPCTVQPVNCDASAHDVSLHGSSSNRHSLEVSMCDPTVAAVSAIASTTTSLTLEQQKKLSGNNV